MSVMIDKNGKFPHSWLEIKGMTQECILSGSSIEEQVLSSLISMICISIGNFSSERKKKTFKHLVML